MANIPYIPMPMAYNPYIPMPIIQAQGYRDYYIHGHINMPIMDASF